ncbi:hypothetical protein [Maridesulfovibrio sp. FT414]
MDQPFNHAIAIGGCKTAGTMNAKEDIHLSLSNPEEQFEVALEKKKI